MTKTNTTENGQKVILVTGPSGAGRTTAIRVLEDLGHEVIDNLPLSLIDRLLAGHPVDRPMALGVDVRNRDFSVEGLLEVIDTLSQSDLYDVEVLYLDCSRDVLIRRYSETRRRHPLAPSETPDNGILREIDLLTPVRARAGILIDTSDLSPHDLKDEITRWLGRTGREMLAVSVHSFSYKRGLARGLDMVFDARFLRNPHWDPALRALDGRSDAVADYVAADPRFDGFFDRVHDLTEFLLPAYGDEGKSHLAIGFGCTGGQHRSVALAEKLANALAQAGWQVSIRHRELERRAATQGMAPKASG
ncbi:RNase adapter RapZ [Aliiroseovarius subalbicans]|uniref:RNase adapter RapZ n=1 Tax=Aliiroseovarius subalbicans TaxID=2925840 RepID=UPI001F58FBEF|nr:RNase adapter RapZ [Aliiroseovarius subalbicans]MCI2399710.1 RNase adapter RapZ [Aliiroseovarius subalbicans]